MAADRDTTDVTHTGPWVVGIGASAGGLEALQQFFNAVERPSRCAFVVLQHLAPDHKSMMVELLARHTTLSVQAAVDGCELIEETVYLLPPGVSMTLVGNTLLFEPRPSHGLALPIDHFFQSLAKACPERAVGIVLSGSGSDGSLGCEALRQAGAYVLVQTPESARFDSMPRSVLANTQIDACLPPSGLARLAVDIAAGTSTRLSQGGILEVQQLRPALQRVFDQLFSHCGIDFSHYKLPTVMRRLERRMLVTQMASVSDYADMLERTPAEVEHLRRELLIPVTSFFRDPEAFDALSTEVLQHVLRTRPANRPLRVWCAGCATGEEAYTLAITLLEACEAAQSWPGFKVFATDVDPRVLELAAAGSYPAATLSHISEARLNRHFNRQGDRLVVKPELRQMVLFARHNLLEDAPFTRMDVVVCRNTLIYFQADAQDRVLRRMQYALLPGGTLFLGGSESLGSLQPDFSILNNSQKLYRLERAVLGASGLHDGFLRNGGTPRRAVGDVRNGRASSLIDEGLLRLVQDYVPASFLVSSQRQLLHAWGATRRYLRMPEGSGTLDVFRLLPERLGPVAAHVQQLALREAGPHRSVPVQLELDGQQVRITVLARRLDQDDADDCVLLTLEEAPAEVSPNFNGEGQLTEGESLLTLERELSATRQSLQATIEELESSNEELQSTNEELMSSNEELQSTNEELQSVNEELYTVNAEFNAKLDAVNALNADLEGMAQATGIATLFIDPQLALLRFTPEAGMLFRLRPGDTGRSIEDFNSLLLYPELVPDLRRCIDGEDLIEREVPGPHGSHYLARLVAYNARPGLPRRVVVSFIDVTRMRDASRLQFLIDSLPEHIAVLDRQGTIRRVNRAWARFAEGNGANGSCDVGANYLAVLAQSNTVQSQEALSGLQDVLQGHQGGFSLAYDCHSPDEQRWFVMQARPLEGPDKGMVVTHHQVDPSLFNNVAGPGA
ncbi:MAG: chemotaxis protein CheR [Burkholderiales bacterium PBB6]|nr:MAG: chemotaxis protein CheR [Burkholderiales bacterium PBB6]